MKLYEIDQALTEAFEAAIDPETGEIISEEAYAEFCQLEMDFNAKVENTCLYIKNLQAESDMIAAEKKKEIERFDKMKKRSDKEIENLKNYLATCLNGEKFKSALASVSYRNSTSVEVNASASDLPSDLCRWKDPEPDKAAIKAALESGKEIPGCALITKTSVIVK